MVVPGHPVSGHKMALSRHTGGADEARGHAPGRDGSRPDDAAFMAAYSDAGNAATTARASSAESDGPRGEAEEAVDGAMPVAEAGMGPGDASADADAAGSAENRDPSTAEQAPGLQIAQQVVRERRGALASEVGFGRDGAAKSGGFEALASGEGGRWAATGAPGSDQSGVEVDIAARKAEMPRRQVNEPSAAEPMATAGRPAMSDAWSEETGSRPPAHGADLKPASSPSVGGASVTARPQPDQIVWGTPVGMSAETGQPSGWSRPLYRGRVPEDIARTPVDAGKTPPEQGPRSSAPAGADTDATPSRITMDMAQSRAGALPVTAAEPHMLPTDPPSDAGTSTGRTPPAGVVADDVLQSVAAMDRPRSEQALAALRAATESGPSIRRNAEEVSDAPPRVGAEDRSRDADARPGGPPAASGALAEIGRGASSPPPTVGAVSGVSDLSGIGALDGPEQGLGGSASVSGPGTSAPAHAGGPMAQGGTMSTAQTVASQIVASLPRPMSEMGTGTLEVALDPPELGRVRLSLVEIAGAMTLSISAERPETAELMRRHLDLLTQEFTRSGLDAPNVRIGGEGGGAAGRGPGNESAASGGQTASGASLPGSETEAAQSSGTAPAPDPLRALDLRL